ncbi:MAG: TetR/AcrR family transcriptional regulator [Kofleriaceae bacterium]|nr:TetR/AcrR family transcriptional regulator [Kofleriaceae bacterium]
MPAVLREPQQSRSLATRERLLDGTARSLCEVGLAGTSTAAIAARAGVSQGAVFKHFATKADLLGHAVAHMLADMVATFRADIGAAVADAGGDPIRAACVVLWRIFRQPSMRAVFEIYVAARTDDALAARLAPILDGHRAAILIEARRLFPEVAAPSADLDDAVDAVVYAMQGATLGLFAPGPEAGDEHLAFLERLARRELARVARGPQGA